MSSFISSNILLTCLCEAVDCLAHYRSEIRAAALTHLAVYQLGIGGVCQQRVTALLKGNLFVYKGHWGLDERGEVSPLMFNNLSDLLYLPGCMGPREPLGVPQPSNHRHNQDQLV